MNDNEYTIFEDQAYINPTLSSGEQMDFIEKFRDIQNQNNQQIAADTYNLGKALPSNLGGLGGGESYFNARYQTDQVDDMVANLKTAAQAQEFNDVMSNYQNQLKRRYNKAQQAYNRRQRSLLNSPKSSSDGLTDIEIIDSGKKGPVKITTAPIAGHNTSAFTVGGETWVYDEDTGDYWVNGVNRGKNPSKVSVNTNTSGGGGSW